MSFAFNPIAQSETIAKDTRVPSARLKGGSTGCGYGIHTTELQAPSGVVFAGRQAAITSISGGVDSDTVSYFATGSATPVSLNATASGHSFKRLSDKPP